MIQYSCPSSIVKKCSAHGNLTIDLCYVKKIKTKQYYQCGECARIKARGKYDPTKRYLKHLNLYEQSRKKRLKCVYGITIQDYDDMLKKQNGLCAICFADKGSDKHQKFHIDHCHSSKKVRGLLCRKCNIGLANFNDSIQNLERAIKYLRPK